MLAQRLNFDNEPSSREVSNSGKSEQIRGHRYAKRIVASEINDQAKRLDGNAPSIVPSLEEMVAAITEKLIAGALIQGVEKLRWVTKSCRLLTRCLPVEPAGFASTGAPQRDGTGSWFDLYSTIQWLRYLAFQL